ncbi:N- methylation [Campylobacter concisus]|jgi:hypothetical protein|uniref:DUF4006 family protein n=2 Tax=Campylobacter concisus TaxID=199 RepID=A0A0M4SLK0_9BACT|nr:DUF4006 family protein [Campylobacter concisus]MDO4874493.1 DUF4006 family protein [Campylobacter sp.]ALF47009.1 putative DUF4006 domain protein [Campylobacter concisus]ERJ26405.1 Putative periplasmic protein [Campylobacter concisus ATCC 51562]MBE9828216.1 DUF4006 family protein [Campylobacter concisus]OJJ29338.1 N- methylation [Campylobacter concisus]
MENKNRNIFALNGISGYLVAVLLLLSILGVLTYIGIGLQKDVATKPYSLKDASSIEMKSVDNAKHVIIKE